MIPRLSASLERASARAYRLLRRFRRARAGVAAVEFAFILPMMLVLYFGIVVLGQGLEVGRKVALASRTLADLTAQQLPSTVGIGNCAATTTTPCVTDANLNDFFTGAELVMTPFPPTPLPTTSTVMSATLTEVIFGNLHTATNGVPATSCCRARVIWSAGFGSSPTLRACGLLAESANGSNGPTLMPASNYPGGKGDAGTSSAKVFATANSTDYYLIVADVTYMFKPGYDFKLFDWGGDAHGGQGYTVTQTTYMTPRYDASTSITWNPDGTIPTAKYHNCPCITGSSTSCTVGAANPTTSSGSYYIP